MHYLLIMHLLFIGDSAVGKSHIIHTLSNSNQTYDPKVTIGINYKLCNLLNKNYYLWDLPGSPRLFKVLMSYLNRKFHYSFIVCHINREESMRNIEYYMSELRNINSDSKFSYHIFINTSLSSINNAQTNNINLLKKKYEDNISIIDSYDLISLQSVLSNVLSKKD